MTSSAESMRQRDLRYRDVDTVEHSFPDGAGQGYRYRDRTPTGLRRSAELQRQADQVAIRREELSQTVSALAEKFDVKARAREAASDLRSAARERLTPEVVLRALIVAGSLTAAICGVVMLRRRRETNDPLAY